SRELKALIEERDSTSGGKIKGQGKGNPLLVTLIDEKSNTIINGLMLKAGVARLKKRRHVVLDELEKYEAEARTSRHSDFEERSNHYEDLLATESSARFGKKGIHHYDRTRPFKELCGNQKLIYGKVMWKKRKLPTVVVTEVLGGGEFYVQAISDPNIASIKQQLASLSLKDAAVSGAFNPKNGDLLAYIKVPTLYEKYGQQAAVLLSQHTLAEGKEFKAVIEKGNISAGEVKGEGTETMLSVTLLDEEANTSINAIMLKAGLARLDVRRRWEPRRQGVLDDLEN
ncbi:ribonuclease TUDOR 1-like protein, partial [Tanacetum coccineum]